MPLRLDGRDLEEQLPQKTHAPKFVETGSGSTATPLIATTITLSAEMAETHCEHSNSAGNVLEAQPQPKTFESRFVATAYGLTQMLLIETMATLSVGKAAVPHVNLKLVGTEAEVRNQQRMTELTFVEMARNIQL